MSTLHKLILKIVLGLPAILCSSAALAAPFTPGNVVVYRVGDGSGSLVNTGNAVFIDEYTSSGSLVQSIAVPTSGASQLIASGTAATEGQISFSTNNQYLLLTGYDASPGGATNLTTSTSAAINRVIGTVDATTGAFTRTNALSDFASGGSPQGIASNNGTQFWVGGSAGGVRYVTGAGATTSTQLSTTATNIRDVGIYNGQLYASTVGTGGLRLGTVGTGLPTTSGQTISSLPGIPGGGSPNGFYLTDLDAGVAGVDTLYVAYDGGQAVTKFSLVGGTWVSNGKVGSNSDDFRGLTAVVNGSAVTLFATRNGGTGPAGGGDLVTITDASGYNGVFTGSFSQIAVAGSQTAFRGIAYVAAVPEPGAIALGGLVMLFAGSTYRWRRRKSRGG